jgi:hypothetical protein
MPSSVIAGKFMPRAIGPWLVDLQSDIHVSLKKNSSQDERNVEGTSRNVAEYGHSVSVTEGQDDK